MNEGKFPLSAGSSVRKRAASLAAETTGPGTRRLWLELAEDAASEGDWLLAEYAYMRGLGLRMLW